MSSIKLLLFANKLEMLSIFLQLVSLRHRFIVNINNAIFLMMNDEERCKNKR